jgi:hypothetical protein
MRTCAAGACRKNICAVRKMLSQCWSVGNCRENVNFCLPELGTFLFVQEMPVGVQLAYHLHAGGGGGAVQPLAGRIPLFEGKIAHYVLDTGFSCCSTCQYLQYGYLK